jgi:DNA repair exonuclease SbcCD ATPase subunit
MIHVSSIRINGFKAIQSLSLQPNGKHVEITGANGQGKSSLIDAVWVALTGQDVPTVPVHRECIKGAIEVGLTDGHTVTRSFTPSGSKLSIEGPDGQKITTSPQKFLDGLVGRISFDPFSFAELAPGKQKAILTELLGLDFSDLDADKARLLQEKRDATAEAKAAERQVDELASVTTAEPVDVSALLEKQKARQTAAEAVSVAQSDFVNISTKLEEVDARVILSNKEIEADLAKLEEMRASINAKQARLEDLRGSRARGADAKAVAETKVHGAREALAALPDVTEAIATAGAKNKQADDWARKTRLTASWKALTEKLQKLDLDLKSTEEERVRRLTEAKFPVAGLTFSDSGVMFNNLPFDKQSQCMSDILKVGVAIAIAQNPGVRIARIKDGSLLDEASMEKLLATLTKYGFQAFVEVVSSGELQAIVLDEEA